MTIQVSSEDYADMRENGGGFCLSCEEEAWGVEPDARNYKCDSCGEKQVFGIEDLLVMGAIEIEGDFDGEFDAETDF